MIPYKLVILEMILTQSKWLVLIALICSAIGVLYLPGVNAGFLLDDYGSIKPISSWGRIDSIDEVIAYLKTGLRAGPTGRPIALLSFLPSAKDWPNSSASFLTINVIIHILVTGILAGFLRSLLRTAGFAQFDRIALLATVVWAFHPFHVSTVLYAVQRMTSLAMLFSVLAFWAYLPLREALQQRRFLPSAIWTALLGMASLLAFGSKEMAVLIPQFLLVMEWLLGRRKESKRGPWLRGWIIIFAWLPCVYVWFYLVRIGIYPGGYEHRDFSVTDRLLTEIGVVGLYIQSLLIPKVVTPGLFYDGYPIVRSLFSSPATMLWAIFHFGIVITAVFVRHRWPLYTFSALWFYGGHLLESTTIPLELVFEHRNYLPSLGVSILLAVGLNKLWNRYQIGRWLAGFTVFLLIFLLYQRVSFWASPLERAVVWAEELPHSPRAQENAFAILFRSNRLEAGNYYLNRSIDLAPDNPYLKIKKIANECQQYQHVRNFDWAALDRNLKNANRDFRLYELMSELLRFAFDESCEGLTTQRIDEMISSALTNRQIQKSSVAGNLLQLRGEINLYYDDFDEAKYHFSEARRKMLDPSVGVYQARLLASSQYYDEAMKILNELIETESVDYFVREQAQDVRNQIAKEMRE